MAYYKGPIWKRFAQQRKAERYYAGRPLSPLPELREFSPHHQLAGQPTSQVSLLSEKDESKCATGRTDGSPARFSKTSRLRRRKVGRKSTGTGQAPADPK